mgnify:CR=1 FL=1
MKNFDMILKEIAKKEGVSPETVYSEMQKAIDAGFDSPDPQARAAWKDIHYEGPRPTPEEVIAYCALRLAPQKSIKQ